MSNILINKIEETFWTSEEITLKIFLELISTQTPVKVVASTDVVGRYTILGQGTALEVYKNISNINDYVESVYLDNSELIIVI